MGSGVMSNRCNFHRRYFPPSASLLQLVVPTTVEATVKLPTPHPVAQSVQAREQIAGNCAPALSSDHHPQVKGDRFRDGPDEPVDHDEP